MKASVLRLLTDARAKGNWVLPGLVDMHVHFRDPGFIQKEDILTGLSAAAAGGFTTVVTMANTVPVCDNRKIIKYQKRLAKRAKLGRLLPICAVTKGMEGKELVDIKSFAYSDDGKMIEDAGIMEDAFKKKMLVFAHYDDPEHELMKRDIDLAIKHNARLHIQHVSTAASIEVIRAARKNHSHLITAEVTPHHFTLTQEAVKKHGTNAKMAPPLRTQKDVDAIIKALQDGTISVIATDHAPHSREEKSQHFDKAPNGVTGLETAVGLTLTHLYHTGKLDVDQIVRLLCINPAKILGLKLYKEYITEDVTEIFAKTDFTIIDPNFEWTVDSSKFHSKSKNHPYEGIQLKGKVLYTVCNGRVIYGKISS